MNRNEVCGSILAVLFMAGDAIAVPELASALDMDADEMDEIVQEVIEERKNREDGILLTRIGDKIQLCTNPKYGGFIKEFLKPDEHMSLTAAVMETLSIIAYKQPVTRAEIDEIRGVRSNYAVSTLMERGLVYVVGQKDVLGHPYLFATTDEFLRHFGISSLEELPKIDLELLEQEQQEDNDDDSL
ncbi:MAG: SMC-Scp complex subunit ScpB [Christensenella sp.]|nr:SMC-Scp complex subunit ScpB [Christensenella sp.]